jgi:hypothetical protein
MGLSVGQQQSNFPHVALFDQLHLLQRPFSLAGLAGQNVTVVRLRKRVSSGPGLFKALGSRPVGFDFRHNLSP